VIKAVIFDFGNVICRFDNKIIFERVSAHTGRIVSELESIVYGAPDLVVGYERGTIASDEFYVRLKTMCGLRMSKAEFIRAYTDKFTPIPETFDLIRRLKGRYKLGLLSNTSEWDFDHEIRTVEVFPLFDAVTVSFQVHALKPEKRIYLDALTKLDLEPHESVYIDDIDKYVEAARSLGMNAIHYRSPQQLEKSLKETLLA
jgi:epoxide hydrolase-like predicted phosphatase